MEPGDTSTIYLVCIKGHLDERWLRWFEGLDISQTPKGETLIRGAMDQATLHGILNRIRDLNMELISVHQIGRHEWNYSNY